MTTTPRGLMPAPPTAIDADGNLTKPAMQKVVRHMLDGGASGLVPLGGTGEFTALSPRTRIACVEACVEAADGAAVYAGVLAPGRAPGSAAGLVVRPTTVLKVSFAVVPMIAFSSAAEPRPGT